MLVWVVFLSWLQRGLTYADDSFNWLLLSGLGSFKNLVEPYGGHLIFIPLFLYKGVMGVFGTSYTAFGVVQFAFLLSISALLYVYSRSRIGPLIAVIPAVVILFLGSSWNVLLQPMVGIQFAAPLVAGIAALLCLERDGRRWDIAACLFLVAGTWSFEIAFAFIAGAIVSIGLRPDRLRRAPIVLIPLLSYGIWFIWARSYGGSGLDLSNLIWTPAYVVDSIGVAATALFGRVTWVGSGQLTALKLYGFNLDNLSGGLVLLWFIAIAAYAVVQRTRARGPIPPTFWVALAVPLTLWVEQSLALAPARTPGEIRYIFPGGVVLLLFAVEAARGVRGSRAMLAGVAILGLAAVIGNLPRFQEGRAILANYSTTAKASMTAMEIGGAAVTPGYSPATTPPAASDGVQVFIGEPQLHSLVDDFGSPTWSVDELEKQADSVREVVDGVLAQALELKLAPTVRRRGAACSAPAPGKPATLRFGDNILVAQARSEILLRRFASTYTVDLGPVRRGQSARLSLPPDQAPGRPWQLQTPDSGRIRIRICK